MNQSPGFYSPQIRRIVIGCAALVVSVMVPGAAATTIYNESVSGDLSNSGLSPTQVSINSGLNEIFGSTGGGANGVDRDYLTFVVPTGFELAGIIPLPGTASGGLVSFIGLQAGAQVTVPTNAQTAAGLLGWWHYSAADINTNILAEMSIPATGSSGFSVPLGPGAYSLWIQDFNSGSFSYGFDLNVVAATAAPEPASYVLTAIGMLAIGAVSRRLRRA
jgi:hypothetical protein